MSDNGPIVTDQEQRILELESDIHALEATQKKFATALMVYDVTVACLEAFTRPDLKGMLDSQIKAARDAYREVTGEDPLILTSAVATDSELE